MDPAQIVVDGTDITGKAFTVTVDVAKVEDTQPFVPVPATV